MKEIFSWNFIYTGILKAQTNDNETLFLFTDNEENPNIFILCEKIEINQKKKEK